MSSDLQLGAGLRRLFPQGKKLVRLFGDPDLMLHVMAADLAAFQLLYDERPSKLPSVLRLTSTLVMKTVVPSRSLPL
jgi:DNA-binding Lrp family transcriptional regulator